MVIVVTNYMCYISTTSVLDKHTRCVKKQFDTLCAVLTQQNSQDNTPEIFCVAMRNQYLQCYYNKSRSFVEVDIEIGQVNQENFCILCRY